jgi:hypothetical protein
MLSAAMAVAISYSLPAAAAVRTVHLQSTITLTCDGSNLCEGKFPRGSANRQFNVTRVACRLNGPPGSALEAADVFLKDSSGLPFGTFLTHVHSSSTGVHEVSDAVDIRVAAGQQLLIILNLDSGIAGTAFCSETGTTDLRP